MSVLNKLTTIGRKPCKCVVVKGEYEDRPAIGGLFLGAK